MGIEDIKPQSIVRELAHWEGQQEKAQAVVDYCQAKIDACCEILRASNIIWVEDERWKQ
jgi:hypothetical protein